MLHAHAGLGLLFQRTAGALPGLRPLAVAILRGLELDPALAAAGDDHTHVDGVEAGAQVGLDVDIEGLVPARAEFAPAVTGSAVLHAAEPPGGDYLQPVTAVRPDIDQGPVDDHLDPVVEARLDEGEFLDLVDVLDGESGAPIEDGAITAPVVVADGADGQIGVGVGPAHVALHGIQIDAAGVAFDGAVAGQVEGLLAANLLVHAPLGAVFLRPGGRGSGRRDLLAAAVLAGELLPEQDLRIGADGVAALDDGIVAVDVEARAAQGTVLYEAADLAVGQGLPCGVLDAEARAVVLGFRDVGALVAGHRGQVGAGSRIRYAGVVRIAEILAELQGLIAGEVRRWRCERKRETSQKQDGHTSHGRTSSRSRHCLARVPSVVPSASRAITLRA